MTELKLIILQMFIARDERLLALLDKLHIAKAKDLIERFNRLQQGAWESTHEPR